MSMRLQQNGFQEMPGIHSAVAALQFEVKLMRFALLLKRFDPDQLRIPAGNPNGGRWTGDDRVQAANRSGPRYGRPDLRVPNFSGAPPVQQFRLTQTAISVSQAAKRTQQLDPARRPPSSISAGIEARVICFTPSLRLFVSLPQWHCRS